MPTLDALLTIWVKFTALLVGWELVAEYSHGFRLFHGRLVQFKNTGVVAGPNIVYAESCGREEHRAVKCHRKDERKQELAIVAMQQILRRGTLNVGIFAVLSIFYVQQRLKC